MSGASLGSKAKERAVSRICHRVIPCSTNAATRRGGVCNMLMSSSVSLRGATPFSRDQSILLKLMITTPNGPRRIQTATLHPSLVRTNQLTCVDAALPDLSRIFLHQWKRSSKQRIVLGIGCQRNATCSTRETEPQPSSGS